MASVDNRVVAMQFDNNAFQTKIASTIASLDKLKTSLDFSNSNRGLKDLQTSANSFNLNGIAAATDHIASKFDAMGAAATATIWNIVNRAVDAGVSITKAFTIQPLIAGFREYETNLNAIQTVLANTMGDNTTLEDVNRALDQMNEYSDKTIYNFGQMARNIGTFTAAGVNLDTSVSAIKGIANLAAVSGSNAEQASTAMYQLSQALASGSVKLMDWNSVVNAGMGGAVFQKALWETGRALGTIKDVPMGQTFDEWKDAGNSFRASLEQGWITADVLTNTLSGFTGDLSKAQILSMGYTEAQADEIVKMGIVAVEAATKVKTFTQLLSTVKETIGSGWSQSFRTIIGDFEEARVLWTGVNKVLGGMASASADARNELLQGWKDLGGRTLLVAGLKHAFEALMGILKPIKMAFRSIFPKQTAQDLLRLTFQFDQLMQKLTPSPTVIFLLRRAFRGIFATFSIGWEVVKGIAGVFGDLFGIFTNASDPSKGILGFAAKLGDGIVALKEALVDGGGIKAFFDNLRETIKSFFDGLTLGNVLERLKTLLIGFFGGFENTPIVEIASAALERLSERFGWVVTAAKAVGEAMGWVWEKVLVVKNALSNFVEWLGEKFAGLPQKIADILAKTNYSKALDVVNVGLMAGLVLMFKKFFDNGPGGLFSGIKETFTGLQGVFKTISTSFSTLTSTLTAMQNNVKADTLMKIAIAVGILTASMLVLAMMDSAALTKALTAMAIGFGQLIGTMALLEKTSNGVMSAGKMGILAAGLILLAGAMLVLAVAAKIFATMSWEEMAKGLIAISALLFVITKLVGPLSANSAGMIKAGAGILLIAIALNLLATAAKIFATMSWEEMAKGLLGVAASLAILAGGLYLINLAGGTGPVTGAGLILVAVALNILAAAVLAFGSMDLKTMGIGLGAIAATLLLLAGAMYIMPNGVSLALQGAGLLAIGIGLVAMATAIGLLGSMSWENLIKGLAGVAVTLGLLAGAMYLMKGTIRGAAAMVIAAVALRILASAVKAFASLSWADLIKGLLGLGITMAILVVGMNALSGGIPVMLAFGAALVLIGGAMALFGLGANLLATAFSLIATSGTQAIAVLVELVFELIKLIPPLAVAIAKGLVAIAKEILKAAPGLIKSMGKVITALLQLIIDSIPKLVETFVALIKAGLDAIRQTFPDILATGFELLLEFLHGISDNIAEITTTVATIIVQFLTALTEKMPEIVAAGIALLVSFLEGVAKDIDTILSAAGDIIAKFIEGLGAQATKIVDAGVAAAISFIEGLGKNAIALANAALDFIVDLLNGLAKAIDSHNDDFRNAGIRIAAAIGDGMMLGVPGMASDFVLGLTSDIGGSVDGADLGGVGYRAGNKFGAGVKSGARDALEINSPSKVFIAIAKSIGEGFGMGLDHDTTAEDSTSRFGNRVVSSIQKALSKVPDIIDGMKDFNPTITPVLDLSKVKNGARSLGDILGLAPELPANVSYGQARQISYDANARQEETLAVAQPAITREVNFNQTINSPTALPVTEIYRRTKSQIAMAKEELAVA